jgi:biopolymer transport protein ExbD
MKLKKAPPPVSDINVTPMVDVMLVVLIIFMVITPMLNKGANIELPKARNPIALPDADHARRPGISQPWTRARQCGRSCAEGARSAAE